MRPPRRIIPQRRRLFVGCEGESEQGYVAWLTRLAEARRVAVHLDAFLLQPGGGDPLAIIEQAVARADQQAARRGDYERRFVLLDRDKFGHSPQRDARIPQVAANGSIELVWQRPCHEAIILRHLDGCQNRQPQTSPLAGQQLGAAWPAYRKPMTAARLADRLDVDAVARISAVEPELAAMLGIIGLV